MTEIVQKCRGFHKELIEVIKNRKKIDFQNEHEDIRLSIASTTVQMRHITKELRALEPHLLDDPQYKQTLDYSNLFERYFNETAKLVGGMVIAKDYNLCLPVFRDHQSRVD